MNSIDAWTLQLDLLDQLLADGHLNGRGLVANYDTLTACRPTVPAKLQAKVDHLLSRIEDEHEAASLDRVDEVGE